MLNYWGALGWLVDGRTLRTRTHAPALDSALIFAVQCKQFSLRNGSNLGFDRFGEFGAAPPALESGCEFRLGHNWGSPMATHAIAHRAHWHGSHLRAHCPNSRISNSNIFERVNPQWRGDRASQGRVSLRA